MPRKLSAPRNGDRDAMFSISEVEGWGGLGRSSGGVGWVGKVEWWGGVGWENSAAEAVEDLGERLEAGGE
jgi:hypothetical protein